MDIDRPAVNTENILRTRYFVTRTGARASSKEICKSATLHGVVCFEAREIGDDV